METTREEIEKTVFAQEQKAEVVAAIVQNAAETVLSDYERPPELGEEVRQSSAGELVSMRRDYHKAVVKLHNDAKDNAWHRTAAKSVFRAADSRPKEEQRISRTLNQQKASEVEKKLARVNVDALALLQSLVSSADRAFQDAENPKKKIDPRAAPLSSWLKEQLTDNIETACKAFEDSTTASVGAAMDDLRGVFNRPSQAVKEFFSHQDGEKKDAPDEASEIRRALAAAQKKAA